MSGPHGNCDELVQQFEATVKGAHESGTFAGGLCGPKSLLAQVMGCLLAAPPEEKTVGKLLAALDELDGRIREKRVPPVYLRDATLPGRWAGLSWLVRSYPTGRSSAAFGECLSQARAAFDRVWDDANLGADFQSPSLADPATALAADRGLFANVDGYLRPWTPGSWAVWDALCPRNRTANPVAVETTPVLFAAGGQGLVLRLVVEALPGPPGLVTPDWWRLGLCAFDTRDPGRRLLPAVQRVIRLAAATAAGLRFRWHLDADQRDAWRVGLDGRSVEAAAAVATLAVLQQYAELRQQEDGSAKPEPVLDHQAVVTGVVGGGGPAVASDRPLEPVGKETLPAKLVAAGGHGLDVVGVPATQPMDGVTVPAGVRVEKLATVGEAFELLSAVSRALDRYGEYVRSQFKYHEEETPGEHDEEEAPR
jgi:hypothetical protein